MRQARQVRHAPARASRPGSTAAPISRKTASISSLRRTGTAATRIFYGTMDGVAARQVTDFSRLPAGIVGSPRLSPDGKRVAFDARVRGNADIYVIPIAGGQPTRLTTHEGVDVVPTWSPDGAWIYFTSRRTGGPKPGGSLPPAVTRSRSRGEGAFAAQPSADGRELDLRANPRPTARSSAARSPAGPNHQRSSMPAARRALSRCSPPGDQRATASSSSKQAPHGRPGWRRLPRSGLSTARRARSAGSRYSPRQRLARPVTGRLA